MCTVSWTRDEAGGRHLWFSRDELRTRTPGEPPGVRIRGGTQVLAPRDPDGGGTWLLANEFGLAACLLNDWRGGPAPAASRSRGLLLEELAGARTAPQAGAALGRAVRQASHAPCRVLVFPPGSPGGRAAPGRAVPVHVLHWDGSDLRSVPAPVVPLAASSSAVPGRQVTARRRQRLVALARDPERPEPTALRALHMEPGPAGDPVAVCMSRPDARTESLVHLVLPPSGGSASRIRMTGRPRQGDGGFGPPVSALLPLHPTLRGST